MGGLGGASLGGLALGADDLLQLRQSLGVGEQLAGGKQIRLVDGVGHALGFGIKETHAVDLVPEQLHTQRVRALDQLPLVIVEGGVGRADVHDAAADGELTGALHHVHPSVPRPHQSGGQIRGLNGGVVVQMHRGGAELVGRDGVAQSRVGGGDDGIVAPRDEPRQHLQPLMLVFVRGRDPRAVEGEIAGGVEGGLETEPLQSLLHADTVLLLVADDQSGLFGGFGGGVEQTGVLDERNDKGLGGTLAQAVSQKGQRLILEIAADGREKLAVLGVDADGGGEKVHRVPFCGKRREG